MSDRATLALGLVASLALAVPAAGQEAETTPLDPKSPLWDMPNVVMTPHVAGFYQDYVDDVLPIVIENMRAYLAGRPDAMQNVVAH